MKYLVVFSACVAVVAFLIWSALIAVVAALLTIAAYMLMGGRRTFHIGRVPIDEDAAWVFLKLGVAGLVVGPILTVWAAYVGFRVDWSSWPVILIASYSIGSVGGAVLIGYLIWAADMGEEEPRQEEVAPSQPPRVETRIVYVQPPPPPSPFA
ncbi:MAG TPA: hypothetical protein VIN06_02270, partial [Devosia sp.]